MKFTTKKIKKNYESVKYLLSLTKVKLNKINSNPKKLTKTK